LSREQLRRAALTAGGSNPATHIYKSLGVWQNDSPIRRSGDTSDNVEEFFELLSPARQAQLERELGLAIVGTHSCKGLLRDGRVHPAFESCIFCTGDLKNPGHSFGPTELMQDDIMKEDFLCEGEARQRAIR
jgi:hypothetical protein